ncbi:MULTISPECIES: hypothetical protein [unclassified Rhodococcus (in: high G+C Gram-positive bacteria)]|uniref:hypothetical protein n=1 Tax=unclassified Rhodococcus (in: high G+C Gram-positive bacteria) TaxID=192944 RepID=UPI003397AB4E
MDVPAESENDAQQNDDERIRTDDSEQGEEPGYRLAARGDCAPAAKGVVVPGGG